MEIVEESEADSALGQLTSILQTNGSATPTAVAVAPTPPSSSIQQIRIINSDGSISNLSTMNRKNIRVISSNQIQFQQQQQQQMQQQPRPVQTFTVAPPPSTQQHYNNAKAPIPIAIKPVAIAPSSINKSFEIMTASNINNKIGGFIPLHTQSTSTSNISINSNLSNTSSLINEDQENILLNSENNSSKSSSRKPCNCNKSQCLKLYCDCFAAGEFCRDCNCNNCYNNLNHELERRKAIKQCLERNPDAFRPKVERVDDSVEVKRQHHKGCNCKKSGCLKNYCECYEAKISCGEHCRCLGCKNNTDSTQSVTLNNGDVSMISNILETSASSSSLEIQTKSPPPPPFVSELKSKILPFTNYYAEKPTGNLQDPFCFVTKDVIDASCQCLLAKAEEGEKAPGRKRSHVEIEGMVLEEFGRCLKQIVDMSNTKKLEINLL